MVNIVWLKRLVNLFDVRKVYYTFCVKLYSAIVAIIQSSNSSYSFIDVFMNKSHRVAI